MFDTTTGIVVPIASGVVRSTSKRDGTADRLGAMKTPARATSACGGPPARLARDVVGASASQPRFPDGAGGRARLTADATRCHGDAGTADTVAAMTDATPVVLVHGWGGSFASTWQSSGFTELLRDAGRTVVG
eukprot:gene35018-57899_t